jgi:hypothetical protein
MVQTMNLDFRDQKLWKVGLVAGGIAGLLEILFSILGWS